eukprot:c11059_g1_i2.p1 GENE.c11059_g1_i2~~c11059_g1_i2.p1  ORF type:complete len:140 (-),score=19.33 c11059_g1_i2:40-459(-)
MVDWAVSCAPLTCDFGSTISASVTLAFREPLCECSGESHTLHVEFCPDIVNDEPFISLIQAPTSLGTPPHLSGTVQTQVPFLAVQALSREQALNCGELRFSCSCPQQQQQLQNRQTHFSFLTRVHKTTQSLALTIFAAA